MKTFLLVFLMSLGCVSASDHGSRKQTFFSAKQVLEFIPGVASKEDILRKFGNPMLRTTQERNEVWHYSSPHTGFTTAIFTFNSENKLNSTLWIPTGDEVDTKAAKIMADLEPHQFEPIYTIENGPDYWRRIINWVARDSGITIVQYENRQEAEAVARVSPNSEGYAKFGEFLNPLRQQSSEK